MLFLLMRSRNSDFVQTYSELIQVLKMASMASIQCALRENTAAQKCGSSIAVERIELHWAPH